MRGTCHSSFSCNKHDPFSVLFFILFMTVWRKAKQSVHVLCFISCHQPCHLPRPRLDRPHRRLRWCPASWRWRVQEQFTVSAHASATFLKVNSPAFSAFIETLGGNDQTLMQDVIFVETTIGQTKLQGNVLAPLQKGCVVPAWRALLKHAGMAPPSLGAAMPASVASAPSKVAPILSPFSASAARVDTTRGDAAVDASATARDFVPESGGLARL